MMGKEREKIHEVTKAITRSSFYSDIRKWAPDYKYKLTGELKSFFFLLIDLPFIYTPTGNS